MTGGCLGYRNPCVNGDTHGGLCERRGERDLLAVGPHPSLAEPIVALNRAYHAWVKTQPQLILDLWGDYGLEQEDSSSVLLLEPVPPPSHTSPRGGLTVGGTEPRLVPGLTATQSDPPGHPALTLGVVVGAANSTTTGAGANHCPVTRARPQKGL